MEDEFGADDSLLEAMAAAADRVSSQQSRRLDKPPPTSSSGSKIVQPTPQALPQRGTGSHILVSPRQRGNPILTFIRAMGWEYSDIPADYVMGQTTCALFLSLRYHRLHPEYVYTRIQKLQGKYSLRILLVMVDIPNHEDSLRELSKTSLVNNITIILCWSAAEAGRYLELYKSYEHAGFTAIKGQQATSYADRLVEFVTVPRNLNKSDAVALVANFGSLKNAINADQEQLSMLNGWGGAKVKRWSKAVEEPFRARKATKKAVRKPPAGGNVAQNAARNALLEDAIPISRTMQADSTPGASNPSKAGQFQLRRPG
uniref:ERCC1-like central domain-containing protein n=1 Tax=Bionectria ochroleuca TaxID=29856 RepID=A0A8H7NNI0_BIOOC